MKKFLLPLLTVMVLLCTQGIVAQTSLSGVITDAEDQYPLEQVEVYFPKIEKGTVTDANGEFTLQNLPLGEYKLVVSYLGYTAYTKSVLLKAGTNTIEIALTPSAIEMDEVILSTPFHQLQRENVMKVETIKMSELAASGAATLAQGITDIPGVESLSTGVGIGKPVIRGLSSNRVVVYTQGVRLENQQFGDEHGLGINGAGIESVEVIKGPASLLYGSDALGGVLYINPEKFAKEHETHADAGVDYFTNTEGIMGTVGVKTSGEKLKFLVRGSATSHVDYDTGSTYRVTNSRFKEEDLKAGLGYQESNFKTELRYNYNFSNLGIPEELGEQSTDRTPILPSQEIGTHILSSKTNIFFNKSSLEATLGYTFNTRKEFEEHHHDEEEEEGAEEEHEEHAEGEEPALHMELSTFNYNLQYHLPKYGKWETIVGVQGMNQTNKNYGEELLIPDARVTDIGFMATTHLHLNVSDIQFGLRYDYREIDGEVNGIEGEEGYIPEVDRNFGSINAAVGFKTNISNALLTRINIATGFRAPNLAELTSNGGHEGANRYEIGNADLNNEQNIQTDLGLEYQNDHIEFYVNGFYNSINDYIYIEPNGEVLEEDPVYVYQQQNARLYGGEIGVHFHPHPLDWLHVKSNFETVTGKLESKDYLPLIPANKVTNTIKVDLNKKDSYVQNSYAFVTLKSVFKQDNVSEFETPTDGYSLLNLGVGGEITVFNKPLEIKVNANNILDKNYVSHLSRLKADGISNIGRNINIGMHLYL